MLLVDTYHHISDRVGYFGEVARALRPGGTLTVVDFDPAAETDHGPPPEHRIGLEQVTAELSRSGYVRVRTSSALPHQYVGVFGVAEAQADVTWLASHQPAQLFDVRTPEEFASGHVPGARNVPLDALDPATLEVDRSAPVVLICRSGSRSARAAAQLGAAGLQTINVEGGTLAWIAAGHPIE